MDQKSIQKFNLLFKGCYYLSSFLLQYLTLVIVLAVGNIVDIIEPDAFIYGFNDNTIYFDILIFALSWFSLNYVKNTLSNVKTYVNTNNTYDVNLTYQVNFNEYKFLNIFVPLVILIISALLPINPLMIILVLQIGTIGYYKLTSKVFLNSSITLTQFRLYKADNATSNNHIKYVWIKSYKDFSNTKAKVLPCLPAITNPVLAIKAIH